MYDLIIIGGGPAAITAGIYAARKKVNTLLITKEFGGQMALGHKVENWPGTPSMAGMDLVSNFVGHLKKFEIEIREGELVREVKRFKGVFFEINTDKGAYQTKSVMVATVKSPRELDVPGVKEFSGKGISYCATCDVPLFGDKIVAIIGAGDAGLDTAWQLTYYAKKIYILNKYSELKSDNVILQEKIKDNPKIEILYQAEAREIKGTKFVESLVYEQAGIKKEVVVDGIFAEIGSVPNSSLVENLVKLNGREEIVIDPRTNGTSVTGIFAAGDVTDISQKQIVVAAGEGARAALSVYEYLKSRNI